MRKTILAGNWKMNQTSSMVQAELQSLLQQLPSVQAEIIVAPSFLYITQAIQLTKESPIHIAAQTMHWEEKGAFTGEVSPMMLADVHVTHVILGHSERRMYSNETNETVHKKVQAALAHQLTPIICCGETLEEREKGQMESVISTQIRCALSGVRETELKQCVIAYEPVWAIGTGKTATPEQAQEVCAFIRSLIVAMYTKEQAEEVSILYGGSMNATNASQLLKQPDIDGGLIGGASLRAEDFLAIIKQVP
ncbi:triose-phosphate isomerase [uncultured Megasphaera sp.]|uniref:triose-phosphate isomerase n=1 Tax=uncultured Megasphaera sp. TaxID=165188 RepID=UPI0025925F87|nr:triose-phosphate isomerase [uncultured Megasphaera sp.]